MNTLSSETPIFVLNQTNALKFNSFRKISLPPNAWHKFTILNAAYLDREKILKTLVERVQHELYPLFYQIDGQNANFIARNCNLAMERLCRSNLIIEIEGGVLLVLNIVLGGGKPPISNFNLQDYLVQIIKKRYNSQTKTLNLDNFHRDPDLQEKVYFSLCHTKFLLYICNSFKSMMISNLRLSNNEIKSLSPLESLWYSSQWFMCLDLRNNLIENMISLNPLKNMHITELLLDGNPVCQNYEEVGYVRAVKEICPHIESLDGVLLGLKGFPASRRNYLVNLKAQELIDQFIEYFFTMYDGRDRKNLCGLYHKDAMFSLTYSYLPGHITSSTAKLEQYRAKSRNLKTLSDLSKSSTFLSVGPADIVKTLSELPMTEHDPYTFTIDLLYYAAKMATFMVTGVFREPVHNLLDTERFFGFARTFTLLVGDDNEYNIVNEQLHVTNATTIQVQKAFKIVRVAKVESSVFQNLTVTEKADIIRTLSLISTLKSDWAKKCLEDADWDLKEALSTFIKLYKDDKIPQEAFISPN